MAQLSLLRSWPPATTSAPARTGVAAGQAVVPDVALPARVCACRTQCSPPSRWHSAISAGIDLDLEIANRDRGAAWHRGLTDGLRPAGRLSRRRTTTDLTLGAVASMAPLCRPLLALASLLFAVSGAENPACKLAAASLPRFKYETSCASPRMIVARAACCLTLTLTRPEPGAGTLLKCAGSVQTAGTPRWGTSRTSARAARSRSSSRSTTPRSGG